jgi:F0F1-type ATP synthase assembly protein I
MAVAMAWVHQIITISLMMALPALGGYWLDERWGTKPWLVICGAVLGFAVAMTTLLRLVGEMNKKKPPGKGDSAS